ncbi:MAG: helix-turn-helix domain-containing protein [Clostridiales bacterium]|nr:helix-turn-helix domain-containing protein [Clostridiales bacterium]
MDLSLKLLLSELHIDLETPLHDNPRFSSYEIYVPGNADQTESVLLIARLSEALTAAKGKSLSFLCVRDRRQDALETAEALRQVYVINQNMDQKELLNAVRQVFSRIESWVMQMQESVLANRGMQDLMRLCEPIIGNHISVMDASFNLLAYTKNVEADDESLLHLVDSGYHPEVAQPEETLQLLLKHRPIEQFETAGEDGLIVSHDARVSQYATVKKLYRYNDSFYAIVTMVCSPREYSEAIEELYKLLLKYITYYFVKEQPQFAQLRYIESFLSELIRNTFLSEDEAKNRARSLHLPFEGCFELNLIVFHDTLDIPAVRLAQDLSIRLKDTNAIVYNRDILVLHRVAGTEDNESRRKLLADMIGELPCNCGVSNTFESLWDMGSAYAQAQAAVSIGELLRLGENGESGFRFYPYEAYWYYHLIANSIDITPSVLANSVAFKAVKTLQLYDEKHGSTLQKTLLSYLEQERNATSSGMLLHMHRNTVLYNIRKIEDILGLSLDEADTRMKLLLGLYAARMNRI